MTTRVFSLVILVAILTWGGCGGGSSSHVSQEPASPKGQTAHLAGELPVNELIEGACKRLIDQLTASGKLTGKVAAVVPLTDTTGGVRRLGVLAAEGIERRLLAAGIKLVERQRLDSLLNEIDRKAALSGDGKVLREARKISGADVLVVGRTVSSGSNLLLSAKALATAGGNVGVMLSSAGNESLPAECLGELMWYVQRPTESDEAGRELPKLAILHEFSSPTPLGDTRLSDGSVVRSGQKFRITVRPNSDCYLYVLLYDSQGGASVLFPHRKIQQGNFARGGVLQTIPLNPTWYWFDNNTGTETFYIVASYTPLTDLDEKLKTMQLAIKQKGSRNTASAARKHIDTVVTRGADSRTAAQFNPKGYSIGERGVNVSDFPSLGGRAAAAGAPDLVVGHATVVQKITLEHVD